MTRKKDSIAQQKQVLFFGLQIKFRTLGDGLGVVHQVLLTGQMFQPW